MIETIHQWQSVFVEDGVFTCAKAIGDHTNELTAAEFEAIVSSVAIRQQTYSTGRFCAKSALLDIGVERQRYANGLLRQADGSTIGSISHTNDWAIAAVAKTGGKYASLGIDLEKIDRVDSGVLRLIATDDERAELELHPELGWGRVALFSIKESLYKCLRPIYGEFIQFKDVQISNMNAPLNPSTTSNLSKNKIEFYSPTVKLLLPALAECCKEQRIQARLAILPSHVLSFVSYRAEDR